MFRRVLQWLGLAANGVGGPMPTASRSPHWPMVRAAQLKRQPECQVCGTREECEAHHCKPFHLYPTLELAPDNLITLCRAHHLLVGHLMRWASWNPNVRTDAALWRSKIKHRPEAA